MMVEGKGSGLTTSWRITRRQFLRVLATAGGAALCSSALYPIIRYLLPPKGKGVDVSNVVAAKVGDLAPNTAKIFRFGNKPALLIMTERGSYKALSATCTHLNCTVQFDEEAKGIRCACHNGRFDLNGQVISGPPPRPLDEFTVTKQGGDIIVSKPS